MLLRLAQKGLQSDIRDKKTAADIDSGIVRLRRQRANHRWVLDGSTTSSRPPKLARGNGGAQSSSASGGSNGVRISTAPERSTASGHSASRPVNSR